MHTHTHTLAFTLRWYVEYKDVSMWSTRGDVSPTPCEVAGWQYDDTYAAWGISDMVFEKIPNVENKEPNAQSCGANA